MRPAMKTGLPVRIKNSYNPSHPGTLIAARRDCGETLVTAITFKRGIELVDIVSTRMLGQYGSVPRGVPWVCSLLPCKNSSRHRIHDYVEVNSKGQSRAGQPAFVYI